MGIPKFFRWLSERYPLINQTITGNMLPPEFDNLYLDMNGIIHNCTHPNNGEENFLARLTEKEMVLGIFHYIDKLFHMIKPKKVFYLAIDGVAPRAKLNQQRQRRFRSAKDRREALEAAEAKGVPIPSEKPFDSNCITPGTEFMTNLSGNLKFFIKKKIQEDASWRRCKIIFSGHEVPGEGEHKIMEYIRHMKSQPDWDPNTSHCLYGLDADLIMLGLTTHEPHFSLLREDVLTKMGRNQAKDPAGRSFHLLHLSLVREYLDLEFSALRNTLIFQYDLERIIDDFVLMCFFVGNDFLPNLPGQDIAEGTFNTMFEKYKQTLPSLGGYITEYASINFERLEKFIAIISDHERAMFEIVPLGLDKLTDGPTHSSNNNNYELEGRKQLTASQQKRFERDLKSLGVSDGSYSDEDDESWKENYYKDKFRKQVMEDKEFHQKVLESYIQGIVWVLNYYHHGCISWGWFYPYLYAPLGSDLKNLSKLNINFEFGQPFLPFLQLMAVLPQDSSDFLPEPYRKLMTDPNSPIYDYYPKEFSIDLNGKQNAWEGVALIPFVDQVKLATVCNTIDPSTLTEEERRRNSFGDAHSYKHNSNTKYLCKTPLPDIFMDIYDCSADEEVYSLPPFPTGKHLGFRLCNGVRVGLQSPAGFPTLQGIPFTPVLRFLHVNIFGSNSRKESLTLKVAFDESLDALTIIDRARPLLGSTCYVNWPYFREAMVTGLSYTFGQAAVDGDFKFTRMDTDAWRKESEFIQNTLLSRKAVDIVSLPVLLHARLFEKMQETADGKLVKTWSDAEELVPIQLVVKSILVTDPRYLEQGPLQPVDKFPVGQKIIYTGPEQYGAVGEVLEHDKNGTRFRIMVQPQVIPHFGKQIASQMKENYYNFEVAAKMLGIATRTLAKVTGRVPVDPGNQNLGLNMKFSGKSEQIIGYSRRLGSQWEFSDKAMSVLSEYLKRFPAVFRMLELKPDNMAYSIQDLYAEFARDQPAPSTPKQQQLINIPSSQPNVKSSPSASRKEVIPDETEIAKTASDKSLPVEVVKASKPKGQPTENDKEEDEEEEDVELPHDDNAKKLKEIKTWIKSLELSKLNRVPTGSMGMPKEAIIKVEEEATKFAQSTESNLKRAAVLNAVYPDYLVKPGTFAEYPRAYLGDRVAVVAENTPLPFGAYGTIVAVKGEFADVIFDKEYVGATTLNRTCSDLRGACLPLHSLLNLTQGWAQLKKGNNGYGQREDNRAEYSHHPRHHNQDNRNQGNYKDNRNQRDNYRDNNQSNYRDNRNQDRDNNQSNNYRDNRNQDRDNRNQDRDNRRDNRNSQEIKILARNDKQSPAEPRPQNNAPQQPAPQQQARPQQSAPQAQVQGTPQVQQGNQQPRQQKPRNDKRNVMRQSNQGVSLNVQNQSQPQQQIPQQQAPQQVPQQPAQQSQMHQPHHGKKDEDYDPTAYWNSLQQQYQPQAPLQFPQSTPLQPPPSFGNVQLPPFANDPYMMQQYMLALQQQYQQLAIQQAQSQNAPQNQQQQQSFQPQFNQQPQQFQPQQQQVQFAEPPSQPRAQELNWQQRELLQKGNRKSQPRNDQQGGQRKPKQQGTKHKSHDGNWQPKDQMKKSM